MTLLTYLSIALIVMCIGATAHYIKESEYNPFSSMVLSLLWPFTMPVVILSIILTQRKRKNKL